MSAKHSRSVGLNVGRLVELDLAFLGPRVIVVEFGIGVAGCLLLGFLSLAYAMRNQLALWSWPVLLGLELVAIGINYVPLFVEALRRYADQVTIEATRAAMRGDPGEARSYGIRQAWILVPAAVVLFALADRRRVRRARP